AYCLWQFRTLKTYQPLPPVEVDAEESRRGRLYQEEWAFQPSTAEFELDNELEEDEQDDPLSHNMTQAERHGCHETAWKFLQAHQDSEVIIAVFLPFYRSFW